MVQSTRKCSNRDPIHEVGSGARGDVGPRAQMGLKSVAQLGEELKVKIISGHQYVMQN